MISLIAREEIWYFAIILFQGVRGYERLNLGSSKALYSPLSRQYKCLIETGTWLGDGIQAALESGFRQVISCDINEELVMQARSRFQNQPVQVHLGSSEQVLKTLMLDVSEPTVFFLDAHAMPPSSEAQVFSAATLLPGHEDDQSLQCPLQQEIKIILESGYSGHTILIDDRQCFDTWLFHYLSEETIRAQVESLCPGRYSFAYFRNVLCISPIGIKIPREASYLLIARKAKKLLDIMRH